jgi:hypothetical protein
MPDTLTPGAIAYAAYVTAIERRPQPAAVLGAMWARLLPAEQRVWEAVAQAVRDHTDFPPLDLRLDEEETPHA